MSLHSNSVVITSEDCDQSQPPYYSFTYTFPSNVNFGNVTLSPQSIQVPFSNGNFSNSTMGTLPGYNNATFYYVFAGQTGTVNLCPTGAVNAWYDISSINQALQTTMINNNHYLYSGSGSSQSYTFFLTLQENPTYYACQINSAALPTSSGAAVAAGYTQPSGATWSFSTGTAYPQLVIPNISSTLYNTSFGTSLGFSTGSYPAYPFYTGGNGATQTFLSNFTPQINPVTSIQMLVNAVDNRLAGNNQVAYSFNAGDTTYGDYISIYPPQNIQLKCSNGLFPTLRVSFVDQSLRNFVPFLDPTSTILLTLNEKA